MFNFNKPLTDEVAFPSKPGSGQAARAQFMVLFNELKDTVNNIPGQMAGQVSHFAMATAPDGWIKADGAAISRTVYATLFAAIGTIYGLGDGALTFNLPDLRGSFVRGLDNEKGLDTGRVLGSYQADDNKAHQHTSVALIDLNGANGNYDSDGVSTRVGLHDFGMWGINSDSVGTESRPKNIALLACIKY